MNGANLRFSQLFMMMRLIIVGESKDAATHAQRQQYQRNSHGSTTGRKVYASYGGESK